MGHTQEDGRKEKQELGKKGKENFWFEAFQRSRDNLMFLLSTILRRRVEAMETDDQIRAAVLFCF